MFVTLDDYPNRDGICVHLTRDDVRDLHIDLRVVIDEGYELESASAELLREMEGYAAQP